MSIVLQSSGGGSVTIQEPATASNFTATLPAATGDVMVSGNMPAFSAYESSAQSYSSSTFTKATFTTEEFDTNSNFASSRFTPTVAGYYQLSAGVVMSATGQTNSIVALYKNGSDYKRFGSINPTTALSNFTGTGSITVYANGTTDYFEIYIYTTGTSPATYGGQNLTWFTGAMVRSA
jgi:hypothetical protein